MHAGGENADPCASAKTRRPGARAGRRASLRRKRSLTEDRSTIPYNPREPASAGVPLDMGASERAGNAGLGRGRAGLDGEAAQKILRAAHAVARRGTPIIERLEILLERGRRLIGRRLVPFASPKSGLRGEARFGVAAMPPKARRASRMRPCDQFEPKGPANRRDVFIEALADLRHMETGKRRRASAPAPLSTNSPGRRSWRL